NKPPSIGACPCGTGYQTRAHILQECARYNDYRDFLRKVSPTIYIPDILTDTPRSTRETPSFEDEPDVEEEEDEEDTDDNS
ncbi:hypothetical protein C8J57DRAFT_1092578, partial [Mycena rebaudengoi]